MVNSTNIIYNRKLANLYLPTKELYHLNKWSQQRMLGDLSSRFRLLWKPSVIELVNIDTMAQIGLPNEIPSNADF
jgi:hypothetical protein